MIKKLFARQGFRFLFVGGLNTLVGYGVYAILLFLHFNYLVANSISTVIGVLHSYLWNRFFTFKSKEKAGKEFMKFISVYVVSYLMGMVSLYCFTGVLHLSPYIAGLINLVITTLISYFGHKYFSFNHERKLNFLTKKYRKNPKLFLLWCLFFLIFAFVFLNFLFGDLLITTNASIIFDKLFFKGDLINLYAASYHPYEAGMFAGTNITYDFPIYIFFGLWNLPLYIYSLFSKVSWELSFLNILYAKTFLLVLVFFCLLVMKKILVLFHLEKESSMYNFLFLSSCLVIMVIGMFGGYEILSILFTLLGIYYYLKDDLKKFTFFFAIAISLKLFALLIFIPLLLLKEKKVWKIILYGLGAISLLALAKIIYHNAPMYMESMTSFEDNMFAKLSLSYIVSPFGNISIFVFLYALVCIWCYSKKIFDHNLQNLYTLYIPLVIFGFFTVFCQIHPQWIILLAPYLIFFLIYNKENRKLNLFLEIGFSVTNLLLFYQVYTWVFCPSLMNSMLINTFIPPHNNITGLPILERINLGQFNAIIGGIMVACFLYFLYLNKPEKLQNQMKDEGWSYSVLLTRLLVIVPFVGIIVYYYFR